MTSEAGGGTVTSRVEAEGSSIDEAIERALAELGVSREEARVEILQDAKRGLLGFGGQKARVAVTVRPRGGFDAGAAEAAPEPATKPLPRPQREEPQAIPRPRREEPRPSPRPEAASQPRRESEPAPATARREAEDVSPAALGEASSVLGEMLRRMELEARVDSAPAQGDGPAALRIVTEHSALVIGRHGQTLDALEYLVNRIVGKQEERGTRIVVDCEDYRERHRRELEDAANRLAEKVRSRGKSQTMTPMSPRDRRIVHVALAGQNDVVTRSVGQGYLRRIVIAPARGNRAAASRS